MIIISNPAPVARNWALASLGASAAASSTFSGYTANTVIGGTHLYSEAGQWADNTSGVYPDWVQVSLPAAKAISKIAAVTLTDDPATTTQPIENVTTFSLYGVTSMYFQVWNGSAWVTAANVTGNNKVWRSETFNSVTTDKVRVQINAALANFSRIIAVEAWGL